MIASSDGEFVLGAGVHVDDRKEACERRRCQGLPIRADVDIANGRPDEVSPTFPAIQIDGDQVALSVTHNQLVVSENRRVNPRAVLQQRQPRVHFVVLGLEPGQQISGDADRRSTVEMARIERKQLGVGTEDCVVRIALSGPISETRLFV